jgi:hypothetical protein
MASTEPKMNKQAASGKGHNNTITETLEIIRKPGSATNQVIIMAANKIGLLTTYGIKKQGERITCKNLVQ